MGQRLRIDRDCWGSLRSDTLFPAVPAPELPNMSTEPTIPDLHVTLPLRPRSVRRSVLLWCLRVASVILLVLAVFAVWYIQHMLLPRNFAGAGEKLPLELSSGPFFTLYYCGEEQPRGMVVLGTGSGGWSQWEEKTAQHLISRGLAVVSWDCRKFADSRTFREAQLVEGMQATVQAGFERVGTDDLPLWYGGWSTGAEQSVPAAATADRPKQLVGLLLVAPARRGRFGMTKSDLLGLEATGEGSFALADYAGGLSGLRIAQFAADLDPLDDVTWLKSLRTPHRIFELKGKLHDMGGAGPDFQKALDEAIEWTLEKPAG